MPYPPHGQIPAAPPGFPPVMAGAGTTHWPPPPPPSGPTGSGSNPWPVVAAVFVGLWAICVTVFTQPLGWLIEQVLLSAGIALPPWVWPLISLVNALLVAVPAALLAGLPRSPAVRGAGRVWLLGAFAVGLLGAVRAIPLPQNELYLGIFALTAALAAFGLGRLGRRDPHRTAERTPSAAALFAGAGGLALLLPWLWLGALGGLVETLLAGAAAAAVGWLVATILNAGFWSAYSSGSRLRLVSLGGLVSGVGLLLFAAATGQSGAQLAALLALPSAGFAAAALHAGTFPAGFSARRVPDGQTQDPGRAGPAATALLVGLAAFGPLAFADPEEISLPLLSRRDVPFWVLVAAASTLLVALLLGSGYAITFARRTATVLPRWVGAVTAAALLLTAGGVYTGLGQPGLYGEKLFVVLKQQADLSDIPATFGPAGRDTRVTQVYQRLVDTATRSQANLRRELDRWRLDYTPYYLVNAIEVEAGPALRAWLSRHDDVDRVLLNQRVRPLPAAAPTAHGAARAPEGPVWNLTMIGADRVHSQLDVNGSGIVVGSSDSGVDGTHPALSTGFRGGDDSWYDPWNGTRSPTDHGGHGTHTLGTAVGGQHIGVAPGARWVGCVNLDRNLGNPALYLDCLQFMLAPFPLGGDPFTDGRPHRAPHVLTNSWGCPALEGCDPRALAPATAALAAAGIAMIAAAGNSGPFCGSINAPPAPYADVLTVGAVDRDRRVTDFSSRGPATGGANKPDLVAPGAGVLSAMPGGGYTALDGTSMATPHVAGVVALMWSANPALIGDLDRTRQLLRDSTTTAEIADPSGETVERCGDPANLTGAGLIDAYAVVQTVRSLA